MRPELFALYAGPDQLMSFTSILAGLLGILLIIRNKIVALFYKVTSIFRRSPEPDAPEVQPRTPAEHP